MFAYKLTFFALLIAFTNSVNAGVFVIGETCIDNVKINVMPGDAELSDYSQWDRLNVSLPSIWDRLFNKEIWTTPRHWSKIIVFDNSIIQLENHRPLRSCDDLKPQANLDGKANVILEAKLITLGVSGFSSSSNSGHRISIPPGKFQFSADTSSLEFSAVGGGTLTIPPSTLTMKNKTAMIFDKSTPPQGELEFHVKQATLNRQQFSFQGGFHIFADLKLTDTYKGGQFEVNINTWKAKIEEGDFFGSVIASTGEQIETGKLSIVNPLVKHGSIKLSAQQGTLNGVLSISSAEASEIRANYSNILVTSASTMFEINSLNLRDFRLLDSEYYIQNTNGGEMSFLDSQLTLSVNSTQILHGIGTATVKNVGLESESRKLKINNPEFENIPLNLEAAQKSELLLESQGNKESSNLKLITSLKSVAISGIKLHGDSQLKVDTSLNNTAIDIPILIDWPHTAGGVELSDYDQAVAVQGDIEKGHLSGLLHLSLTDTKDSKFEIPVNGLAIAMGSVFSTKPWLAGTKPFFGNARVDITNMEPVSIGQLNSQGEFIMTPSIFALGEIVSRRDSKSEAIRTSLSLNAKGIASISIPASGGEMVLKKAHFEADDTELKVVDTDKELDFGILLKNGSAKIKHLVLDVDRDKNSAFFIMQQITSQATYMRQIESSEDGEDEIFSGVPTQPIEIETIQATPEFNSNSLTFKNWEARNVSAGINQAKIELGKDSEIVDASVVISADALTSNNDLIDGNESKSSLVYNNLRIRANGTLNSKDFSNKPKIYSLDVKLNGPENLYSGEGTAVLGTMQLDDVSDWKLPFKCAGNGSISVPRHVHGELIGGRLELSAIDRKWTNIAWLPASLLYIESDKSAECESDPEKWIISPAQEYWTWGVCPTWSEPFRRCKWSTWVPEVSIGYHFKYGFYAFKAAASLISPVVILSEEKVKVCYLPNTITFIGPVIAAGVTPQMDCQQPYTDACKAVNAIGHNAMTTIESSILTGLVTGTFGFANAIVNEPTIAGYACFTGANR